MRARQRHFNAQAAGATLVLDARFLTANADDSIGTWTSRTGINDATQATAANKPTYKVNMSGGQPALYFDGNDSMGFASSIISGTPDGFATFIYKVDADPPASIFTAGQSNSRKEGVGYEGEARMVRSRQILVGSQHRPGFSQEILSQAIESHRGHLRTLAPSRIR